MARSVVGVDIGASGIRVVQTSTKGKGVPRITKTGFAPLKPRTVEGGAVLDAEAVTSALVALWKEHKFSKQNVRLAVGSGSVLVRHLDLDWMPEADLRKSLRYQVQDLLPVPVADANLDFVWLGEHQTTPDVDDDVDETSFESRRLASVLLVATSREVVDGHVRACNAAKLRPSVVDLGALALVRAATVAGPAGGEVETEAVVDIGVDKLAVSIYRGGLPLSVRVIPGFGGGLITRVLSEETERSWQQAEQVKCSEVALPAPGQPPRTRDEAVALAAVQRLCAEVRSTLDFQVAANQEHSPARVLVAGATSAMPGLCENMASLLGIPVAPLPFPDGTQAANAVDASFGIAYGLSCEVTL